MTKKVKCVEDCGGIPMPKPDVTELVFILDRSGSMAGLEKDTVGGFNAMIEKQKKEEGIALVSTVLFSNTSKVLHDRVKVREIRPLTEKEYTVGGCTALLDAIGCAIHHIGNVHKYARPEDVPTRTLFIITTDGMENASVEYSSERVKEMIRRREEENGWEFLFVAANIDAVETADRIGIRPERAANYTADGEGTERLYRILGDTLCSYRRDKRVRADWAEGLSTKKEKKKNNA